MSAVLTLSLSLGSVLSAQQIERGPIRASLESEATRLALAVPMQPPPPASVITSDDRVRITLNTERDSKIIGVVDRLDAQTLTIVPERGPSRTVPLTAIERFERPDGKRSRAAQAFVGTVIGMAGGYGASRVAFDACRESSFLCELDNIMPRLYGITLGGAAGGLIGGFLSPQRWRTVTVSDIPVAGRTVAGPPLQ